MTPNLPPPCGLPTGNVFHTSNQANTTFILDESDGTFVSLSDSVVEDNEVDKAVAAAGKLGTRATKTLLLQPGDSYGVLNYTDSLVFGYAISIDPDSVVCNLHGAHATAVSSAVLPKTTTIAIYLEKAVPATIAPGEAVSITCSVDQSKRTVPAH